MNRIVISLFIIFVAFALKAQELTVVSMDETTEVMTADKQRQDLNGKPCALVYILTPVPDLAFEGNIVGNVEFQNSRYKVYLSSGSKNLRILGSSFVPKMVQFSDYKIGPVEGKRVYNLKVAVPSNGASGSMTEQRSQTGYLLVTSQPDGADVSINGEWVGTTPYQQKYQIGDRLQYRVSRPLYHAEAGEIAIDKAKVEVNAVLKPAYGSIRVTSTPDGAQVYVDDDVQPRGVTPLTIDQVASGQHRLKVQKARYGQRIVDVTVADGQTADAAATLSANFATVTVNSLPGAVIKADGQQRGTGTASWEQGAGLCDIEVSLDGHAPATRQITVEGGADQTVTLEPTPLYGSIAVESQPYGAEIWLDGQQFGTTPNVLDRVLATTHSLRLTKSGCADYSGTVTVRQGEETQVNATLPTGAEVTFEAGDGDQIYLDGSLLGAAPQTITVSYGPHTAYAVNAEDKRGSEQAFTVQTGQSAQRLKLAVTADREFKVNGVTFKMKYVEGGTFTMGATGKLEEFASDSEKPTHSVTLSDYMLGETEVTQALWQAVMGNNPSYSTGNNLPVEKVSWDDCQEFIKKLNSLTGQNFSLPTEAQWEYAAKGGNKAQGYKYAGSDNIGDVAWYEGNSGRKTHPVAAKAANELGLYDMTGNVWEWCSDWYGSYEASAQTNPTGPSSGSYRVSRGGSCYDYGWYCRVSYRGNNIPGGRNDGLGLRLALPL